MAKYTVLITKTVQKQLKKLPDEIAERLEEEMLNLENDPRSRGSRKLKSRDAYRIRIGDFRFIYFIDDKLLMVTVIKVGHRKDIYR